MYMFVYDSRAIGATVYKPTAVVADRSIVCAVEREVRGSIPVWEYVLQGPMSEFETR